MSAVQAPEGVREDALLMQVHEGARIVPIARRSAGTEFTVRQGDRFFTDPVPLSPVPLRTTGRALIVWGSSHGTEFEALDSDGNLQGTYRVRGELERAGRQDYTDYEAWFHENHPSELTLDGRSIESSSLFARFLDKSPRGEQVPLFDSAFLDNDDRLWVREYAPTGPTARWQIATLERGTIARLVIPRSWVVLDVRGDQMVVLERDELDVELVRAYSITH